MMGYAGAHFTAGFHAHQVLTNAEPVSQLALAPRQHVLQGIGFDLPVPRGVRGGRPEATARPWVAAISAVAVNP